MKRKDIGFNVWMNLPHFIITPSIIDAINLIMSIADIIFSIISVLHDVTKDYLNRMMMI